MRIEEWIEKCRGAGINRGFLAVEKDVHRLPQRVIHQLGQFLMYEWIGRASG